MRILSVILLIVLTAGCRQAAKIPENFDYGAVEKGVYKNGFFDMEIPLIQSWEVQTKNVMDQMLDRGVDEINKNNKELGSKVKASQVSTANLLMMVKNPPGSVAAGEFNPSFMLMAENIKLRPDINSGAEYLEEAKKLLKQASSDYVIAPEYTTIKVGDKKIDVMRATRSPVTQLYGATIDKGFALVMILSFIDDQDEDALKSMIQKIKFE